MRVFFYSSIHPPTHLLLPLHLSVHTYREVERVERRVGRASSSSSSWRGMVYV